VLTKTPNHTKVVTDVLIVTPDCFFVVFFDLLGVFCVGGGVHSDPHLLILDVYGHGVCLQLSARPTVPLSFGITAGAPARAEPPFRSWPRARARRRRALFVGDERRRLHRLVAGPAHLSNRVGS
jgi:hypothetical protein